MKMLGRIQFLFLLVLLSPAARAQVETDDTVEREEGSRLEDFDRRLAEQQGLIEAQQEQIAAQQEALEEQKGRITGLSEELEAQQLEELEGELEGGEHKASRLMNIYGFFDLTFTKNFLGDDSPYMIATHQTTSFVFSRLNLYFDSQMTETLSALAEFRFSFLPHGYETNLEVVGPTGETIPGTEYERVDTTVLNPVSLEFSRTGTVYIERAHLTYAPFDWLQVLVGRYLTPYGIWNVDHGPTVILTTAVPYMQIRELVPLAQTGVQVFGRLFPTDRLFFDYAITLSNGRGPIDTIWDLDDNKGVGLKLKLRYEHDRVSFAIGAYGYYGTFTDIKKMIQMEADDPGSLSNVKIQTTDAYRECIGAGDVLLEVNGVRLQTEFVLQYSDRTAATLIEPEFLRLLQEEPGYAGPHYYADNLAKSYYVLLGWELPLRQWIGQVRITPYAMYEHNLSHEAIEMLNARFLTWGLNVKPSPFVALKAEGGILFPTEEGVNDRPKSLHLQMAVFF